MIQAFTPKWSGNVVLEWRNQITLKKQGGKASLGKCNIAQGLSDGHSQWRPSIRIKGSLSENLQTW